MSRALGILLHGSVGLGKVQTEERSHLNMGDAAGKVNSAKVYPQGCSHVSS